MEIQLEDVKGNISTAQLSEIAGRKIESVRIAAGRISHRLLEPDDSRRWNLISQKEMEKLEAGRLLLTVTNNSPNRWLYVIKSHTA